MVMVMAPYLGLNHLDPRLIPHLTLSLTLTLRPDPEPDPVPWFAWKLRFPMQPIASAAGLRSAALNLP